MRKIKPTLVVMAAGIGSRYGGLKQIEPIGPCGEILIDYSVFDAHRVGFGKVVFVIRESIADLFKKMVEDRMAKHIAVDYVMQEITSLPKGFSPPPGRGKPWGTGHAILCCKDAVKEPFAVINADDFYGPNSFKILADYLSGLTTSNAAFCMVGYLLRRTLSEHGSVARGICSLVDRYNLASIVEREEVVQDGEKALFRDGEEWQPLTGDEIVSMNMWGFTPVVFDNLTAHFKEFLNQRGQEQKSEFYLPSVVTSLIKSQDATVQVLETDEQWFGVTYADDRETVMAAIQKHIDKGNYPRNLWGETK